MQRSKVGGGHVLTGEALKKLQQQMKVNREERRLTVSLTCTHSQLHHLLTDERSSYFRNFQWFYFLFI